MAKKHRIGIIGCGMISGVHISGVMESPDLELGAICDMHPERLEEKKKLSGATDDMCFNDYIKMMDSGKIDAVSICTPNYLHYEMAMEAIKRDMPYALEKPVCNTEEEAVKLLEETAGKNIPNMVCFSYRFKTAARYARELTRNGSLGNIYHINGEYYQSWGLEDPATGAKDPLHWRFVQEQSGSGALGDLGCHMIDLFRFITGREFTRITADLGTFIHERSLPGTPAAKGAVDVDDYVSIIGQMDGPVAANMSITRFAYARGNYQRIEVYGDKGAIRYSLEDTDTLEINIGSDPMKEARVWVGIPLPKRFESAQMQSFADIINGRGDGLAATIEDGWESQKIIDRAIRAAQNTVTL